MMTRTTLTEQQILKTYITQRQQHLETSSTSSTPGAPQHEAVCPNDKYLTPKPKRHGNGHKTNIRKLKNGKQYWSQNHCISDIFKNLTAEMLTTLKSFCGDHRVHCNKLILKDRTVRDKFRKCQPILHPIFYFYAKFYVM